MIFEADVNMDQYRCIGHIPSEELVDPLQNFSIWGHMHTETFDFTVLPPNLERLVIGKNWFEGIADLSKLPNTLRELNTAQNRFIGEVDLCHLPPLQKLDLAYNLIQGPLCLTELPENFGRLGAQS